MLDVFIGYDPREHLGYKVACASLLKHCSFPVNINPIWEHPLRERRIYTRPHSFRNGRKWDDISDAPCATEFSIARFAVPLIANSNCRMALFCDVDFLFRADIAEIFFNADYRKAVSVVKHNHQPSESVKMDGQLQTSYPRKNWSSFMLWNLTHTANLRMSEELLNTAAGRDLHALCWLTDDQIGELPAEWNWLDGHSDPAQDPKAVHFTRGTPDMPGYEHTRYAPEWNRYASLLSKGK